MLFYIKIPTSSFIGSIELVSLYFQFVIAPSVFSNFYLTPPLVLSDCTKVGEWVVIYVCLGYKFCLYFTA